MPELLPVAALTFGDVVAAIAVGAALFLAVILALGSQGTRRVSKRVQEHVPADPAHREESGAEMRAAFRNVYAATERVLDRISIWQKLTRVLERSDSTLRPGQLFYVMVGSGLVPVFLLALVHAPLVLLLIVVFPFGAAIPYVVLHIRASQRQKSFDEQLPNLLMSMSASIRVGHSFRQAMQAIVADGREPAAKEFRRVLLEMDLGRPADQALEDMSERLNSKNLEYVVQSVAIQREVGGSLAGLFDMTAETVRNRQRFVKRVRGLTAQGRISAYVLTAMPFLAVALMSAVKPSFTKPLFTTSTGHLLIVIALVGILLGGLILKKMVSFRI